MNLRESLLTATRTWALRGMTVRIQQSHDWKEPWKRVTESKHILSFFSLIEEKVRKHEEGGLRVFEYM